MTMRLSSFAIALIASLPLLSALAAEPTALQVDRAPVSTRDAGSSTLIALYDSSRDTETKEVILGFLAERNDSVSREKLLSVARRDTDPELREVAIRQLAERGQTALLIELYDGEQDTDVKETILHLLGERDDEAALKKLIEAARTATDNRKSVV